MTPLIKVDTEKCNNCHSCIAVCPVKHCLDGSGDKISIIHERCLGCGRCVTACTSHARSINDDAEEFFDALDTHTPMVAVIAPSAVTVFDDIFRLIGFLKSLGVMAVFDVAFGAELTIRSYLEYARKENPDIIIASPCPAIVNYCELYAPHLLRYLAPVQSPMAHTAIMIKNFYHEYAGAKIAAISPCVAKKREFEEAGYIDFNVTMSGFQKILKQRHIGMDDVTPCDFDGPVAERAVSFSSPGGLKNTILRDAPALLKKIRRVEGTFSVYGYLNEIPKMLEENAAPFMVDCLSCSSGCNGGPGTPNFGCPVDLLENKIEARLKEHTRRNKFLFGFNRIKSEISGFWKPDIYSRSYRDRSGSLSGYRQPTEKDLALIYHRMKKTNASDFLNCAACGYGSCRGMAEAIFNGLNRPENCHHYLKKEVDERLQEHGSILEYVRDGIFLLESSGIILPSYSKALEEIFRRDMLAGLPVMDVLAGFLDKEKIKEIDAFIDNAFDISVSDSEIQNNNPLHNVEAHFVNLDGGFDTRYLNFAIERIGDGKTIQKLLVIVRDRKTNFPGDSAETAKEPPPDHFTRTVEKTGTGDHEFGKIENSVSNFAKDKILKKALLALAKKCVEFCADAGTAAERITFKAYYSAGNLYISCRYNGAGLDAAKLASQAVKDGGAEREAADLSGGEKARRFYRICFLDCSDIKGSLRALSCRGIQLFDKKDYCQINLVFQKERGSDLSAGSGYGASTRKILLGR
jgi:iron only hydrogenase large subunit-like protein